MDLIESLMGINSSQTKTKFPYVKKKEKYIKKSKSMTNPHNKNIKKNEKNIIKEIHGNEILYKLNISCGTAWDKNKENFVYVDQKKFKSFVKEII